MEDYEIAVKSLKEHGLEADALGYGGKTSQTVIEKAEEILGFRFPDDYRRYLSEFGAGGNAPYWFYGISSNDISNEDDLNVVSRALRDWESGELPKGVVRIVDCDPDCWTLDLRKQPAEVVYWPFMDEPEPHGMGFGALFLDLVGHTVQFAKMSKGQE